MKKILLSIATAFICGSIFALELPDQISDNMMLQQQTQAKLWGWAKGGSTVNITTSWNQQSYSAKADKKTGRWDVQVSTPSASFDNHTITIVGDGEKRTINQVLIGEVWFCSGQSNMEMPLRGFWNCPTQGATEAIAQCGRYKNAIRVCTIPKVGTDTPQDRVAGQWQTCEPQNAPNFSAVGFFFARTLTDILNIPVGIINCSWGGSTVEGWLPKDTLLTYPDGLTPFNDGDYMRKMVMYNGMLHPLAGYTIKGFLWNQGESNIGREQMYLDRFPTMVQLWRKMWNQPNDALPIYTVELPGYWYDNEEGDICPRFRDVQHQIANTLEHCGCVCTNDLILPYEAKQIHGTRKLEIGQRLAYMAATRDYGVQGIASEAPEFWRTKVVEANPFDVKIIAGSTVGSDPVTKGKIVQVYFKNATDGFDRLSDIEGFEAAGVDGQWHKAIVWADSDWRTPDYQGCFLKLACPEVADIQQIRYNYHNFTTTSLHNNWGLPIVPFCAKVQ